MNSDGIVDLGPVIKNLREAFESGRTFERTEDRMTFEDWEAQPDPVEDEDEGEEE